MRLVPVTKNMWNGVKLICVSCLQINDSEYMWADLDGEPFKAYYCNPCADALKENSNNSQ
jgi:formate dehydrogenase maturation protein FdhE